MSRMRIDSIRNNVEKLLLKNGIYGPPVNVAKIAQSLGAKILYSKYDAEEISGMLIRDGKNVIIGVNSCHSANRQRFTLAHECGHLLLHSGQPIFVDKNFRVNLRDDKSSSATDTEEIEANKFAAELLMPWQFLRKDIPSRSIDIENEIYIKILAKKYQVSTQAMSFRLVNVSELAEMRRIPSS